MFGLVSAKRLREANSFVDVLQKENAKLKKEKSVLIDSADLFGINLRPVLIYEFWMRRSLVLAGAYVKPMISKLKMPDVNDAIHEKGLDRIMRYIPGYGSDSHQRPFRVHYSYLASRANSFFMPDNPLPSEPPQASAPRDEIGGHGLSAQ